MASVNRRVELEDLKQFRITEQPIPSPPPGGAVIKTSYAGLCHSDVHFTHDKNIIDPNFVFPRVLGHETSGVVLSVGTDAKDVKVGDRVLIYPWVFCGDCHECHAYTGSCFKERGFGSNPGGHVYGWMKDGGYETYVCVDDAKMLVHVPDKVPLDAASMVPCSGITSYSAIATLKQSVEGALALKGHATIAFLGAGGLALWAIQISKALYPKAKVVAVDIREDKLADAKAVGADVGHLWSTNGKAMDEADAIIKEHGYLDGAVDFTGIPACAERAYYAMDNRGTLTFVGLGAAKLPTDLGMGVMIFRSVRMAGNLVGSMEHTKSMLSLLEAGKVKPPPITYVTLDQVPDVIMGPLAKGTQKGRAVVKFD